MVLFPCSSCCGCRVCQHSKHDCLTLTLSGFTSNPASQDCSECDHLDGTYVLNRGGDTTATLSVWVAASSGTGAVLEATLAQDPVTEEYTISSVSVASPGGGYSPNATFAYSITNATLSPCPKKPCPSLQ